MVTFLSKDMVCRKMYNFLGHHVSIHMVAQKVVHFDNDIAAYYTQGKI